MLRKLTAVLLMFCLSIAAYASESDVSAASVNQAGELRMLSQRIAKAYTQYGLGISPDLALTQIAEAIRRFNENLEGLEPVVASVKPAKKAHERVLTSWRAFRVLADQAPTPARALALSRASQTVLEAADRLTSALEAASPDKRSQLVNLSGRARMLSQQLSKAYLLFSWGADPDGAREIERIRTAFAERVALLQARSENTPEISRELDEIALQWEWLQAALAVEGAMSYRLIVVEAADSILEATDRLTQLYERVDVR